MIPTSLSVDVDEPYSKNDKEFTGLTKAASKCVNRCLEKGQVFCALIRT